MLHTRHEEYSNAAPLPFNLEVGLTRSSTYNSTEMNWHDDLEVQCITQGEGYVLLNGARRSVKKGDIIVANSNVIHYTGTEGSLRYDCLIIRNAFCKQANIDVARLNFQEVFQSERVEKGFELLIFLLSQREEYNVAKAQREILSLLIELCERHLLARGEVRENEEIQRVQTCIRYVQENFRQKILLEDLSKAVYCSKYVLAKEFKRLTKQTVVEFINRYRCMKALEEITSGTPVFVAALDCGFNNMSYFTKTFQKHVGKLPSACKKKKGGFLPPTFDAL